MPEAGARSEPQLFPVTVVGSWPRPAWLITALRKRQAGEISEQEFQSIADRAVLEAIELQEKAGVDILSDGEQRRDNFYSFVAGKLGGMRLMKVSELMKYMKDRARYEEVLRALDVPAFAIKSPIVVERLREKEGLALDEADFLKKHTSRAIKVPLPGPYMLTRSSWFEGLSDKVYESPEELAADVVKILRKEVIGLKARGVSFIQFDEPILSQIVYGAESTETFMCAALPNRREPVQELELAVRLMNETVAGIDGVKFGVHVCRGNWSRREDVLLQGNYGPMLPYLMEMNVAQLVLEFATPRAGELEVFKEYRNEKEIGFGVVNPRSDRIESPEEIVARVKQLGRYYDAEKIYLNPDCGFGTFAERNVNSAEIAAEKMKSIAEAARRLRAEFQGTKAETASSDGYQERGGIRMRRS